jgi:hypothetical protein
MTRYPKMILREHPLMYHRGICAWPPVWVARGDGSHKALTGEIGTLKEVLPSLGPPRNRIFLIVAHEEIEYMGCLNLQDHSFCRELVSVLRAYRGSPIWQIGSLDLSHLL